MLKLILNIRFPLCILNTVKGRFNTDYALMSCGPLFLIQAVAYSELLMNSLSYGRDISLELTLLSEAKRVFTI